MPTRLLVALIAALLLLRLPSLVQPMGADQSLYAYVGERILAGELAYRDAWDQKPPGIHFVYAALRAISPRDIVVPAADFVSAALVAACLWRLGAQLGSPLAGGLSAVLFLALSDPSLARYGGMRVRAQAETFIGLTVAAAVALAVGVRRGEGTVRLGAAGLLLGAAFVLKYNAGIYALVVLLGMWLTSGLRWRAVSWVALGAAIFPAVLFLVFWRGGALDDLYQATITYNVQYSGETYASQWDMIRYLFIAPIRHARVDPLWFVGGVGCLMLLAASLRNRVAILPVVWVALACVSIAVNGSRDLPQYFLQAAPALALAAGMAAAIALPPLPVAARWMVVVLLAAATWRVGADPFPKLVGNIWQDTLYALGRTDRRAHLARYGSRDIDKYSALDNRDLGEFLASHTTAAETIFVFGYSSGAYVYADRRSASRFFWSRPVIVHFNAAHPSYGIEGLRADLERRNPAYVVLQERDWPDVQNSAAFFRSQPPLAGWLREHYHRLESFIDGFEAWERNVR